MKLCAYVYSADRESVNEAAHRRGEAAELSDAGVAGGCDLSDPRLDIKRRAVAPDAAPPDAVSGGRSMNNAERTHNDRLLATTRALSAFIAPFLFVAFVMLYGFPGETSRLWAWTIQSEMTSMLLASAYLGGCYFFVRVLLVERRWAAVRLGFVAVGLFATLLGVATVLHWDKFIHDRLAFWLWAGLYFIAPLLVGAAFIANQQVAAPTAPDAPRLGRASRLIVAGTGALAVLTGTVMFLAPVRAIPLWPWPLTPLTCRVVGATFCLGAAGMGVLADDRWESMHLMRRVQLLIFTGILVAVVRARHEFLTGRPLTWIMAAGFMGLFVATLASAARGSGREPGPGRDSSRAQPR